MHASDYRRETGECGLTFLHILAEIERFAADSGYERVCNVRLGFGRAGEGTDERGSVRGSGRAEDRAGHQLDSRYVLEQG